MCEDAQLLRRYVEHRVESDFTELVRRNLALVYHAALRRTDGRSDLAEEIVQDVFTLLARQAPKLVSHPVLSGWLYTTTRNVANESIRAERRRRLREQEAQMRNEFHPSDSSASWHQIQRELDDVMDQLPERDREVIVLRYFRGQAFAKIGAIFGLSEEAARKHADRALERLRKKLIERGITSTAAVLGGMLTSQAASAAPLALAPSIASAALAQAVTAPLSTAGLIQIMNAKLTLSAVSMLAFAALIGIGSLGVVAHNRSDLQRTNTEIERTQQSIALKKADLQQLLQKAQGADEHIGKLQADVERVRASLVAENKPAPDGPSAANQASALSASDRQKFFTTYPKARELLRNLGLMQINRIMSPFFQSTQLSPSQIDEFSKRTEALWCDTEIIDLASLSMVPGEEQLPDEQLRDILGEENFQRFQEFARTKPANDLVRWMGVAAGRGATPLSSAQSEQLTQLIIENSNARQPGQKLDSQSVDWKAVATRMQTTLTPQQVQATQIALLNYQFQQAEGRAQAALKSAGSTPKY